MSYREPPVLCAAIGVLVFAASLPAFPAEAPSATPYRPSVSNPAALSAPGYFEVEAGFLRSRNDDPRRRDSLPVLFKYAFTENIGVLVGGEAHVRSYSDVDGKAAGVGDTNLTLKLHHALNDKLAVGLEAGVKLPTAKDRQRGVPGTSQFLTAFSYNVSKTVVLDAGMAWGLTRASTDRSVFAGITVLLR